MTPYYQDDYVTLYHGDCRELLPSIEADVVVTDPPYGIAYASHVGRSGSRLASRPRVFRHLWSGAYRDSENGTYLHPTQKPVALMRWCLGFTTGTILDPFAGSGSTLVAAKSLNRKAIGIEIEERYCEVAANRLRQEVLGLVG